MTDDQINPREFFAMPEGQAPIVISITGSRDYPTSQAHLIYKLLTTLPYGSIVVSGGARGVDDWAGRGAESTFGLTAKIFPVEDAEWKMSKRIYGGMRAGHIRNEFMARYIKAYKGRSFIFANITDGQLSSGSQNMLFQLDTLGVQVMVIDQDGSIFLRRDGVTK